jgi:tRNA1Val (adenine37-N6)-methyltransferase
LNRIFKGWTKPGPLIPQEPNLAEGETCDAISGDYRLYQYKDGHRFSTDDVLVAWFATTYGVRSEKVLDLGSGIGSVGMMTAWRLPNAQLVTVEAQSMSVKLAKKSRDYNQLTHRYDIRESDFREKSWRRENEFFDLVTGSPPYFPESDGVMAEHPQKAACRFELRGNIADYCEAAAEVLSPGGMFFVVFPRNQEERTLAAAKQAGLGVLRSREVIFKAGEAPLLALYQMGKISDYPEALWGKISKWGYREPPLTIRTLDGAVTPEYSVVKLSIGFPP